MSKWLRTIGTVVLAGVLAVLPISIPAHAEPSPPVRTNLPATFSAWNPVVTPDPDREGVYSVEFDSPALGRRVTNSVFLPKNYALGGAPIGAMYYLHGTVIKPFDTPLAGPLTAEFFLAQLAQGGGAVQSDIFHFDSQRDAARFAVVSPDTNRDYSFCHTCLWVDSREPSNPTATDPMKTETFVIKELQPLVEALFNLRTDRGGRGIMGYSMGGISSLLYGTWHPDNYSVVAAVSGGPDISMKNQPVMALSLYALGFLRSQGYDQLDPVMSQQFNPADMAPNMVGQNQKLFFSNGDGCVDPAIAATAPDCATPPFAPTGKIAEAAIIAPENAAGQPLFAAAGVPYTSVVRPGGHGQNNHTVFAMDIVPLANARFAAPPAVPATFTYKSAFADYGIWNYRVSAPSDVPRFSSLKDARTDGTGFTAVADTPMVVTTPAAYTAGVAYEVTTTCGSNGSRRTELTANSEGRLDISLTTGPGTECAVDVAA